MTFYHIFDIISSYCSAWTQISTFIIPQRGITSSERGSSHFILNIKPERIRHYQCLVELMLPSCFPHEHSVQLQPSPAKVAVINEIFFLEPTLMLQFHLQCLHEGNLFFFFSPLFFFSFCACVWITTISIINLSHVRHQSRCIRREDGVMEKTGWGSYSCRVRAHDGGPPWQAARHIFGCRPSVLGLNYTVSWE